MLRSLREKLESKASDILTILNGVTTIRPAGILIVLKNHPKQFIKTSKF